LNYIAQNIEDVSFNGYKDGESCPNADVNKKELEQTERFKEIMKKV